jgi:threonine aldolase
MITAPAVEAAINPPDFYHSPRTRLVCVENTTNKGGGACYDFEELQRIKHVCDSHGLAFHLDGARIWNALVATGQSPLAYGQLFDTISVCLSKGLGCPVGSLLLGSKAAMDQALRVRKVLGGGMRQAGYLAAAGIYALDHQLERLDEDHRKAKELGELLQGKDFVRYVAPLETNIVIFETQPDRITDQELLNVLTSKGIRLISMGQGKLRFVTHLDYTDSMHAYVMDTLEGLSY